MSELNRVLYVEDEPDIQAVAKIALEMVGGFTVKICASGEEALGVVAKPLDPMALASRRTRASAVANR